jgi:hypothetical protein
MGQLSVIRASTSMEATNHSKNHVASVYETLPATSKAATITRRPVRRRTELGRTRR